MAWHLPDHVTMTTVGDDVVFLDVRGDAYLCLPGASKAVARKSYGLVFSDADVLDELANAGLVVERPGTGVARRPAPTATVDLRDEAAPSLRIGDCIAFGATIASNSGRYHGCSLEQMVQLAGQRGEGAVRYSGVAPDAELLRQALVFDRLLPWAPGQEACLYRSFMLVRFLGERGRDANWVFGVRTRPFEAHCWVQAGGVVLNDNVDHIASYAAILVT